jgi:RNA polymerase sigma-70 factor (ECF subfamily)
VTGRRLADRRAPAVGAETPNLPRKARPHRARLAFVELLPPSEQQFEDLDTARLVTRIQAGDSDGFAVLYMRYFDRVYGYLRMVLRNPADAEDATQQVFLDAMQSLPSFEYRGRPVRAWLFTLARNRALSQLRQEGRIELVEAPELRRLGDQRGEQELAEHVLSWVSDRELQVFIERLPLGQRQVLALTYLLDLSLEEAAQVLGRSPEAVRKQRSRALAFLRARLAAIGRRPRRGRVGTRVLVRQAVVLRTRRYSLAYQRPPGTIRRVA